MNGYNGWTRLEIARERHNHETLEARGCAVHECLFCDLVPTVRCESCDANVCDHHANDSQGRTRCLPCVEDEK